MRYLSRLTISAILASAICAGVSAAAPGIEFEKTTLDFGKLLEGQKFKAVFSFKNTGGEPLEITNVDPDCGCTEAKATERKVAAGASASIEAVFDSTGFKGKVTKGINVITNDPANPEIKLEITGEVVPIAILSPPRINFGTLKVGTVREETLVIIPTEPEKFRILKIETKSNQVSVPEFRRARDGKGTYYLKIRITAGDKPGRMFEQMKFVTDLPDNLAIGFLVFGNVAEEVADNAKPA